MQKIQEDQGGKHVNLLEHAAYLGQLGAGNALQPMLGGIDIDAKEDGQEVENSRDQGGLCHGGIGNAQHFRHNKGGGAHDGGHDGSAGGGGGLNRRGKLGLKAVLFHHGNGESAGADDIGRGTAADGAKEAGGHHSHLGGAAAHVAEQGGGQIGHIVADAGDAHDSAQQDEQDHIGGRGIEGGAEDTVCGQIDQRGELLQRHAGLVEEAGNILAQEGVGHKDQGDDDQGIAHLPAARLKDSDNQKNGKQNVAGVHNSGAQLQVFIQDGDVGTAAQGEECHNTEKNLLPTLLAVDHCIDVEDHQQEAQVDRLLRNARHSAERCGVEVKCYKADGQDQRHLF